MQLHFFSFFVSERMAKYAKTKFQKNILLIREKNCSRSHYQHKLLISKKLLLQSAFTLHTQKRDPFMKLKNMHKKALRIK